MKKSIILLSVLLAAVACQTTEELVGPKDWDSTPFTVTFQASTASSDSKVHTSNLKKYWDEGDKIGIFVGGNSNACATIVDGQGKSSGNFSVQLNAVNTPSTVYAYYPYNSSVTSASYIPYNIDNQVYEGDYSEDGNFSGYGKYSFMAARAYNFTISQGSPWPSDYPIYFTSLNGVARFRLSTDIKDGLDIKMIELYCENDRMRLPVAMDIANADGYGIGVVNTNMLSIGLPSKESGKGLTINDKSGYKYVNMAVMPSAFTVGDQLLVMVRCKDSNTGRNRICYVQKEISDASYNFGYNTRTTLLVPVNEDGIWNDACAVWVTTTADAASLETPVIIASDNSTILNESDWGDNCIESYVAGINHTFETSGSHRTMFDYFGTASTVSFYNLNGISEIDFSAFNK